MLTKQEIFDKVKTHLLRQNAKAEELTAANGGSCRYRTSNGLMCAVGCLIPDSLYRTDLEKKSIDRLFSIDWARDLLAQAGLDRREHSDLLDALQQLHDTYHVESWRNQFKAISIRFNLENKEESACS